MTLLLVHTLLLVTAIAGVMGSCPGNCNGHGTCTSNLCVCDSGWAGSDCSMQLIGLSSGSSSENDVPAKGWVYFYVDLATTSNLAFEITQVSGDADEYVQLNTYPTRSTYKYRDISEATDVTITIPNAAAGRWILGVYGFSASTVSVTASFTTAGGCPNNCNGHGTCVSGVCSCTSTYAGVDCSIAVIPMTMNTSYSVTAQQGGSWRYFSANVQTQNHIVFKVTRTSTTGDPDLYVKYNALPNRTFYDFRDTSLSTVFEIDIGSATHGLWYAGIYAYGSSSVDYTIMYYATVHCPNQCSRHGTCMSSQCMCDSGYEGVSCEYRLNGLLPGETVQGFVDDNMWNYMWADVATTNDVDITVRQDTSISGDCDLYVDANSYPTKFTYDYRDISTRPTFTMSIDDPGFETMYIGVYGYRKCLFFLNISYEISCPNNCNGHGSCISSQCVCNEGWAGVGCQYELYSIENNRNLTGYVTADSWAYYKFSMRGSSTCYITLNEITSDTTTGSVWLYSSAKAPDEPYDIPTTNVYDLADTNSESSYHRVIYTFNNAQDANVIIGVYGNPYLSQDSQSFSITVFSPDF